MDYTGVTIQGNNTLLTGVKNFDPSQTLDCGQCFRWSGSGATYRGVAHGRLLEIEFDGGNLLLRGVSAGEFEHVWKDYFDFGRDYSGLHRRFSCDGALKSAADFSPGLRIMRQEPWETLCTFILSQNSNIPRIKGMVEKLCAAFGQPLEDGVYAFPGPERLAFLCEEDLYAIRCGYRAPYIIDAARRVCEGQISLDELYTLPVEDARKKLMEIHGVGPKVAECALLYGFGRVECFPLDVWMKRVMAALYPSGFPQELSDVAGLAQQFLFHYARMNAKSGVLEGEKIS